MPGVRRITREEVNRMLDKASVKDKALILIGLNFGTRVSETLSLTFGDFDGENVIIKAKKGGAVQRYPIPQSVRDVVAELRKKYEKLGHSVTPSTPLFLGRNGKAMSRQAASQRVKRLCKKAGLSDGINTHSFRKAFVTAIYDATGHDIAKTRLYSRHKSLSNLQYYIDSGQSTELVENLSWG